MSLPYLPPRNPETAGITFKLSDWNFQDDPFAYAAKLYETNIFTGQNVFTAYPLIAQMSLFVGSLFNVDTEGNMIAATVQTNTIACSDNTAIAGNVAISADIVCSGALTVGNVAANAINCVNGANFGGNLRHRGQIGAFLNVGGLSLPIVESVVDSTHTCGNVNLQTSSAVTATVMPGYRVLFLNVSSVMLQSVDNISGSSALVVNVVPLATCTKVVLMYGNIAV